MFEQRMDEKPRRKSRAGWWYLICAALLLTPACAGLRPDVPTATPQPPALVTDTLPPATETSSAQPTQVVPADTPTPSPTLTATATPAPSPTPTFTPTPPSDVRLQTGVTFQQQGNYAAAAEQFELLLRDPLIEAEAAAEARYRLGQCHALDGDMAAAVVAFQDFKTAHPDDARLPEARFQQAEAHAALGEWEAAIEGYRAYLSGRDAITGTVHARIGDAYVQLGDDAAALESYETALAGVLTLEGAFALREKMAEIHLRGEDYDLAIAQYEAILALAESDSYRAQITYLLGQAHLLAGDVETAYGHWHQAVARYPRAHHAYLALVALVDAGEDVDQFQRGLVDFYAGVYGPAIQAFYRHLESDAKERRDEARYYIGRAYHLSGSYDLAIQEYETIIANYPDGSTAADAWLEKARSLAAQELTQQAIEALEAFVEARPASPVAPEALWRAAHLHEAAAAWADAAAVYERLYQEYPQSEQAVEALFRAGLNHYRQGAYQAAAEWWQTLVTERADSDRLSAARYWLSKAHRALGDFEQAKRWLTEAASGAAFLPDYYALRAAHLLEEAGGVSPNGSPGGWPSASPNLLLDQDETAARAGAEAWLLEWVDPAGEMVSLASSMETLSQDPRYKRGTAYLAVGLSREAQAEFRALRLALQDDPLKLYGLALAARDLGLYDVSIRCAAQVMRLSPARNFESVPRFLQRLAYPVYFDDLVLKEAAANNLDPLLVFALIRQESLFAAGVSSYAQAIGLMQIIPPTGEWIALRLGWEDFVPAQLTRPHLNIHFGTWFLDQGLSAFHGDVFAALAGYNAGIGAPGRWLAAAGSDPDLFVETIDYSQTLHYVQLIYQHHTLYRRIYGAGG